MDISWVEFVNCDSDTPTSATSGDDWEAVLVAIAKGEIPEDKPEEEEDKQELHVGGGGRYPCHINQTGT